MKTTLKRHATAAIMFAIVPLAFSPALYAAEVSVNDVVEMVRTMIQADRKAVVAANMGLSNEQSKAFWPVYNDYRAEMEKVNDRKVALIADFAKNFEKLGDEKSKELLKENFSVQEDAIKVKEKYIKRFEKVLPSTMVARFYQIDNKFDAVINVKLAENIPLAP